MEFGIVFLTTKFKYFFALGHELMNFMYNSTKDHFAMKNLKSSLEKETGRASGRRIFYASLFRVCTGEISLQMAVAIA